MKTTIECESSKYDDYKRFIDSPRYKEIMASMVKVFNCSLPAIIYNIETGEITHKYSDKTIEAIEKHQELLNDLLADYIK